MKQFVGKKLIFVISEFGKVTAKVVADRKDMVLVKGENDQYPWRIIKNKIIAFQPMEPVDDDVNLLVLQCENPSIGCPGVKYVKEGDGFTQRDFAAFTNPCPKKCGTCRMGSLGELRTIEGGALRDMMAGTMYGDYPETEK